MASRGRGRRSRAGGRWSNAALGPHQALVLVALLLGSASFAGCVGSSPTNPPRPHPAEFPHYPYDLAVVSCYPAVGAILVANEAANATDAWLDSSLNVTDAAHRTVGGGPWAWSTGGPTMARSGVAGNEQFWLTAGNLTPGAYTARFRAGWNPQQTSNASFTCGSPAPPTKTPATNWSIDCSLPSFGLTLQNTTRPVHPDQLLVRYQPPNSSAWVLLGTRLGANTTVPLGSVVSYRNEELGPGPGVNRLSVVYAPTGGTLISATIACPDAGRR